MALDDDQRQLEIIKLCVDYLKHLTTLSGAATIVVLTLMERPGTNAQLLAGPAFFFGVATILCLVGIFYLISGFAFRFLSKRTAGVGFVGSVALTFTIALVSLLIEAFFPISEIVRWLILGVVMLGVPTVTYFLIKYMSDTPPD